MRRLIKTDGTIHELPQPVRMEVIHKLIGADLLDSVMLRHLGNPLHVMMVDDLGVAKKLPVNEKATELYHANCYPGTTHQIRGDVVVVPDSDYADDDE